MIRPAFRLKKPLGLAYTMDEDDALKTKVALRDLGHMKRPDYGLTPYPDQPMIDGIRNFQRGHGLKADGVAKPGGPTERRLNTELMNGRTGRQTETGKHHQPSNQRALKMTKLQTKKEIPVKFATRDDDSENVEPMLTDRGGLKKEESIYPLLFDDTGRATGIWSEGSLIPDAQAEEERRALRAELAADRKRSILSGETSRFVVRRNPEADGRKPLHEFDSLSEVGRFDEIIERTARKSGIDPDLVRAIVHMETTHGGYGRLFQPFDGNKTLRPMNIHAGYWKGMGFSREELKKTSGHPH